MTIDKEQLKALAEAAPEGPWRYWGETANEIFQATGRRVLIIAHDQSVPACEFIAAANPATILALLDEIERLTASYAKELDDQASELYRRRHDISCLKAENEALSKDAERYRYVRDCAYGVATIDGYRIMFEAPMPEGPFTGSAEKLDAAVDVAMAEDNPCTSTT